MHKYIYKLYEYSGCSDDYDFITYLRKVILHRLSPASAQSCIPVLIQGEKVGRVIHPLHVGDSVHIEIETFLPKEVLEVHQPAFSMSNAGYASVELKPKECFNVAGLPVPCF